TYNSSVIDSVKFTSVSGCDSVAVLDLTVNSTLRTVTAATICTNQAPYTWNGNTYNSSVIDSVKLTSVSGCDSVAVLDLTVNSTLRTVTAATIFTNQATYRWNDKTYNSSVIDSVKLTSVSGCDSVAVLDLTVNSTL